MTGPAPSTPVGKPGTPKVETKVTAASGAAAAAGIATAVLNAAVADSALLGALPGWLQFVLVTIGVPAVTGLAAYQAPHTHRPVPSWPPKRIDDDPGPVHD